MKWILTVAWAAIFLASCSAPQAQPTAAVTDADVLVPPETPGAYLPNPASVFCEQQGNRLEIRTASDGSQSGACIFPNGSECDEWAYFRGECKLAPDATQTPEVVPPATGYAPDLVTPDPSAYEGWNEFLETTYGFKFRYPPDWTAELDLRPQSTTYKHLLWLRPSGAALDVVQMIAFEGVGENYGLQRTGIGAGELTERGRVLFLGEPAQRIVLVLEGLDMEVLYGHTGLFDRGDLRFAISLDYAGSERRGLTPALEQTADQIVASFERLR